MSLLIWFIGFLFTYGLLVVLDEIENTHNFDGFKGGAQLLAMTLFLWPAVMGGLIAQAHCKDDDKKGVPCGNHFR